MDSEVIAWISAEHRRRLAWFEEHQGDVSAIPGPLADGLLLVSNPKGIYKPGGLPYAVSIRINLDSPYADGMPVPTPGGGWLLSYHQENADPAARDRMYTNRGLMRCIADRVPVGVLRERAPAGRRSQYDVLGLALPVRWAYGYFFFESLTPKAAPVIDPVSDVLEATAGAEVERQTATESTALGDDYDARLRVYRQIVARQGQPGFRGALTLGHLSARLGHSRFADIPMAVGPQGRSLRIGAHNFEYAEAYWFGETIKTMWSHTMMPGQACSTCHLPTRCPGGARRACWISMTTRAGDFLDLIQKLRTPNGSEPRPLLTH